MKHIVRSALRYFALFILLYGALTAISLVPQVGASMNYLYRQPTGPILTTLFPKVYLQLKGDETDANVLRVEFASKQEVQQQMMQAGQAGQAKTMVQGRDNVISFYNLFLTFYLFLVALILLSPISWKEKAISWVAGTFLFYLYTVFKVYLSMLGIFNQPGIAIYQTGDTLLKVSQTLLYFMTIGTNVLVVLVLWALLTFRKNNWKDLLKVKNFFPD